MSSFTTLLILDWLRYGLLLFGFLSVGTIIVRLLKNNAKLKSLIISNESATSRHPSEQPSLNIKLIKITASVAVICLSLGFAGGYEYGVRKQPVAQAPRNIKPMDGVLVVAKYPNCHYTMRRKDGRNFETDFCSDSPEGCTLEAGYLLTEFNFNQQANCKSTVGLPGESLGFSVYSEHGQKIKFPIGEIAIAR